eukprot:gb/GEZN01012147.1/.p1 GENE.gb/GEZN01012147.1/~~gb/GEZN01012147.1/.p1  ORF type:complete len:259 (-),score=38.70 gb/GEZN01012147.1/:310-1086(-)
MSSNEEFCVTEPLTMYTSPHDSYIASIDLEENTLASYGPSFGKNWFFSGNKLAMLAICLSALSIFIQLGSQTTRGFSTISPDSEVAGASDEGVLRVSGNDKSSKGKDKSSSKSKSGECPPYSYKLSDKLVYVSQPTQVKGNLSFPALQIIESVPATLNGVVAAHLTLEGSVVAYGNKEYINLLGAFYVFDDLNTKGSFILKSVAPVGTSSSPSGLMWEGTLPILQPTGALADRTSSARIKYDDGVATVTLLVEGGCPF